MSRQLERDLRDFRDRFPMDDRAAEYLQKAPSQVQSAVVSDFRPRREGQTDYSALVTNFVQQVRQRLERHGKLERSEKGRRHRSDRSPSDARSEASHSSGSSSSGSGSSCSSSGSHLESHRRVEVAAKASERNDLGEESSARSARERAVAEANEEMMRRIAEAERDANQAKEMEVTQARLQARRDLEARVEKYRAEMEATVKAAEDRAEAVRRERIKAAEVAAKATFERKIALAADRAAESAQEAQRRAAKVKPAKSEKQPQPSKDAVDDEAKRRKKSSERKDRRSSKDRSQHRGEADGSRCEKAERRRARTGHYRRRRTRDETEGRESHRDRDRAGRDAGGSRSVHLQERNTGRRPSVRRSRSARAQLKGSSQSGLAVLLSNGHAEPGPTDSALEAFRERYPMDDRAFDCLVTAAPEVQQSVIAQFKPRREGEDDYSALVATFVRSIQIRQTGHWSGDAAADRGFRQEKAHVVENDQSALAAFRDRYPMDDRAHESLQNAAAHIRSTVLSTFRPRREGEDDYSALIMSFTRGVQLKLGSTGPRGASRSRSRRRR